MITESDLPEHERTFLDECRKIQAMGFFPSAVNFRKHTRYVVPQRIRVGALRKRLVALGLFHLTTEPGTGGNPGTPLPQALKGRLEALSLAEPQQPIPAVWRAFNAETGIERPYSTLKAWVEKIRDRAALPISDVSGEDEEAIKDRMKGELHQPVRKVVKKIGRTIRMRSLLARIDGVSIDGSITPAEACKAILWDFRRRTGEKKSTTPDDFTDAIFSQEVVSMRMERASNTITRRRGANTTVIGEAMAG
jgi:hypothetical protein